MNEDYKLVWSDEWGDMRKSKSSKQSDELSVNEERLFLELRRMTSGKGRTVIEIKGLPNNEKWCLELTKELKKSIGVGGTYKNNFIEIHGEKIESVIKVLEKRKLKWKKVGG